MKSRKYLLGPDCVVAVDFDGTIAESKYPEIGKPLPGAFRVLHRIRGTGAKLILHTIRSGECLEAATEFCRVKGNFVFDAINCNLEQSPGVVHPKVYAHWYIDDSAVGVPLDANYHVDWYAVEKLLFPSKEKPFEDSTVNFEFYADKAGEYRWRLRASNGKILGDSGEGYKTLQDCQHGAGAKLISNYSVSVRADQVDKALEFLTETPRDEHTPGPWFAKVRENAITCPIVSANGVKLAESCAFTPYWTTAANARLIAASPDLLATCEALYEHTKANFQIAGLNEQAKAAIAKAKGESK